jgi:hypothetical protein
MNPLTEKRILLAILRRLDNGHRSWLASPWLSPLLWLLLAGCFFLLFRYAPVIGDLAMILCAALAGNLACLVRNRMESARAWPFIAPHIDKASVERRVSELAR